MRGRVVTPGEPPAIGSAIRTLRQWFDSSVLPEIDPGRERDIDWGRLLPFIGMHVACLGVIWVGVSAVAVWTAVGLYFVRMFAITGFYHRYFSHRSFRTSRVAQFVFAVLGASSVQRGPLWWAAHHRNHHRHSDQSGDTHSPTQDGIVWSHMGWFCARLNFRTKTEAVSDLCRFPELRFLDRYDVVVPVGLALALFAAGVVLGSSAPELGTSGMQMLVWGFFVSTVVLFHATFTINSLAHRFGGRRYDTTDDSRNNLWLALITLGEGWHNNHHHYPHSVRQGFRWWEIDVTFYLLKGMQKIGLIWDLKPVPARSMKATASARAES